MARKVYYRLSAALGDGQSAEVTAEAADVLARVGDWCREFGQVVGNEIIVTTIEMSTEEFRRLPEL
jgi:hypothetical protein